MKVKAHYYICGFDLWCESFETDALICYESTPNPSGRNRVNIYPAEDVHRADRLNQIKQIGFFAGSLIFPYTVLIPDLDNVAVMEAMLKYACIMVGECRLPTRVRIVQWNPVNHALLAPYVDQHGEMILDDDVYALLKMKL